MVSARGTIIHAKRRMTEGATRIRPSTRVCCVAMFASLAACDSPPDARRPAPWAGGGQTWLLVGGAGHLPLRQGLRRGERRVDGRGAGQGRGELLADAG